MPTPTPGQRFILISDWKRFLRVADWWDRTFGQRPPGSLRPTYGQSMIVKTPPGGIDARVGTTLSSATCTKCVAAETATPGEKTLHDTEEELLVWNLHTSDVAGDSFVMTALTANGTRYAGVAGEVQQVVTDFQVTGVTLQIKTRDVLVFPDGDESAWATVHTGTNC